MRPRGMKSKWVKVLPWYYTEKKQPSRATELQDALKQEEVAHDQPTTMNFPLNHVIRDPDGLLAEPKETT